MAMLLTSTSDTVQIVSSSTANLDVYTAWADYDPAVSPATDRATFGRLISKITTATTTTIIPSPAAGDTRKVKVIVISNIHASASNGVTLRIFDGTNSSVQEDVTLAAGERMSYRDGGPIRVVDSLGRERSQTAKAETSQVSLLSDQALAATDTYITGSDYLITGRIKQGSVIRWTTTMTKTGAGVVAPIWVIRFGTAGAIGDTARCTMTGLAQTAAVDTARIEISATIRTLSATGVVQGTMGGDHLQATTGFSVGGFANQATSAAFDLTVANTKAGLSVTPGTSAAWTVKTCIVEGINLLA